MNTISTSSILELGFLTFQDITEIDSFTIGKKHDIADNCLYWLKSISFYSSFSNGLVILSHLDYLDLKKSDLLNTDIIHLTCNDRSARLSFVQILTKVMSHIDISNYVHEHRSSTDDVIIMDNVYIGKNVKIGKKSIIFPNVVIHNGVIIGENCTIRENSCLGTHGMGFEKDMNGDWIRFPQVGGLIIGDNVEIGSHSDIKRAALDNTIIENNCKLGSYTNIGHNCVIGKNSIFTSQCVVAGSNIIGENFYMGINSSIKNGMKIGSNVTVGAHTFVRSNINDGETHVGSPSKKI